MGGWHHRQPVGQFSPTLGTSRAVAKGPRPRSKHLAAAEPAPAPEGSDPLGGCGAAILITGLARPAFQWGPPAGDALPAGTVAHVPKAANSGGWTWHSGVG
jgi:hypothetical protein